jgi:hypothetical protein
MIYTISAAMRQKSLDSYAAARYLSVREDCRKAA